MYIFHQCVTQIQVDIGVSVRSSMPGPMTAVSHMEHVMSSVMAPVDVLMVYLQIDISVREVSMLHLL